MIVEAGGFSIPVVFFYPPACVGQYRELQSRLLDLEDMGAQDKKVGHHGFSLRWVLSEALGNIAAVHSLTREGSRKALKWVSGV